MNGADVTRRNLSPGRRGLLLGAGVVLLGGVWFGLSDGFKNGGLVFHFQLAPMMWATLIFVAGAVAILSGTLAWLKQVEHYTNQRSEEKIQTKDAIVIGAFFSLLLLLAYCVTGAAAAMQFPGRGGAAVVLALTWALASAAVGGAFGFLLGHPRRLAEEKSGERAPMGGLLRTGLDDMVDWLVKGLTTVLLVQATEILGHLRTVSKQMAACLIGAVNGPPPQHEIDAAAAFAQPMIVCFTLLGALASCLLTRTYLTGALGRADRTTTGAFVRVGLDWGEVLLLFNAQRSLTTRYRAPGREVMQVAEQLAALSLEDLDSMQEFAMWAKAKSMVGARDEALKGYEKALAQSDQDPALLLDYAVVLHADGKKDEALAQLQFAYEHLSAATPADTRRNVYKSLTFELLYQPGSFDRVIDLVKEYEKDNPQPSASLLINKACAYGQKFRQIAQQEGLIEEPPKQDTGEVSSRPIKVNLSRDRWPKDLKPVYEAALKAVEAAVKIDPAWKKHLLLPLQKSHPDKAKHPKENDLEVFETCNAFRFALDLPPYSETPPETKSEGTTRETGQPAKDPSKDVSTESADLASKSTKEQPDS